MSARHAPGCDRRRLVVNGLLVTCGALVLASLAAFAVDVAPDARPVARQSPALPTADGIPPITRATLTPEPAVIPTIGVLPPETVTETQTRTVTAVRTAAAPRATTVTATRTETATQTVTSVSTQTVTRTATATVTVTETQQVPILTTPEGTP